MNWPPPPPCKFGCPSQQVRLPHLLNINYARCIELNQLGSKLLNQGAADGLMVYQKGGLERTLLDPPLILSLIYQNWSVSHHHPM